MLRPSPGRSQSGAPLVGQASCPRRTAGKAATWPCLTPFPAIHLTMPIERSLTAPTRFIEANGISYGYRRLGGDAGLPLLCLQHVTGTMDHWDPLVVDGFAAGRPVIIFDNAGISRSTGTTPVTIEEMADHALAFIQGLGLARMDLLGFSMGGFIAQVIAA